MMMKSKVKLKKKENQDKLKKLKLMKAYLVVKVPKMRKTSISIEKIIIIHVTCFRQWDLT